MTVVAVVAAGIASNIVETLFKLPLFYDPRYKCYLL